MVNGGAQSYTADELETMLKQAGIVDTKARAFAKAFDGSTLAQLASPQWDKHPELTPSAGDKAKLRSLTSLKTKF